MPTAGAVDLDFDPHIECSEQSTKLFATISAAKLNLVRPLEKAKRVAQIAKGGGGHFAEALAALRSRIDCVEAFEKKGSGKFRITSRTN